jgi:hypothetical protein
MAQESAEKFYDVLIKELRSEITREIQAEIQAEIQTEIRAEIHSQIMSEKFQSQRRPQPYVRDTESSLLTELGPKFFAAPKKTSYPQNPRPKNAAKDSAAKFQNRRARELTTEESVQLQMLANLGAQLSHPFSESELKKEFRRLAQKFHPDHQVGASETQLTQTQLKFTSLKNCYDSLKKAF